MSPLWRNQLRVVLCPDQVVILGLSRGLRPKVMLQTILPCVPVSDQPNWQAALDAFAYWLGSYEMGKADIVVILSSHFVRYAVMPYSAELVGRTEEQALAQILFEEIYGDLTKQWKIEIGQGGYGDARLIAAVDTSLLDQITVLLKTSPLRLNTITPYLVTAFNRFCRQIPENGLFAVAEAGQMQVIAIQQSQFSSIGRTPLQGKSAVQLSALIQREALNSGLDPSTVPVYLHVVGRPDFEVPHTDGINIYLLQAVGKDALLEIEDPRFDMAKTWE